jgi:RNA polymerase sigma factor (sigma-70 family)
VSRNLQRLEGPGDAELISAVRGGDVDAYGQLFSRHVAAARRLARQLAAAGDADDLVSEAFAKVLGALQRGGGPDLAFRAYLLSTVRRLHVDRLRAASHLHTTDDLTPFDAGVPFRDTALEEFETDAAARAFASLPERWQMVLWHTEVEGQRPAEVAPLLGMSPNSVSALAYRAREGLRQAFVSMHAPADAGRPDCAWTRRHLGSYLRHGLARRDGRRLEEHLRECRACAAVHLELYEENARLAGLLGPAVLGGAAAAYVGGAAATGVGGVGLGVLMGRLRDLALANAPATVAAGVTVSAVVAGGAFLAVQGPEPSSVAEASAGPASTTASSTAHPGRRATSRTPARRSVDPAPAGRERAPAAATPGAEAPTGPTTPPEPTGEPAPASPTTESSAPAGIAPAATASAGAVSPPPASGGVAGPGPVAAPVDLTVTGSATATTTSDGEPAVRVLVGVAGLPGGTRATLRIVSTAPHLALTLDDGCSPTPSGAVCALTGTGGTTTVSLVAGDVPDRPTFLVLWARPEGARDANPADNVARVALAD